MLIFMMILTLSHCKFADLVLWETLDLVLVQRCFILKLEGPVT